MKSAAVGNVPGPEADRPAALLLTPVLPLPGGSGRALRSWDWLCDLARTHRVYVVVVARQAELPPLPPDYPATAVVPVADHVILTRRFRRVFGLLLPPLVTLWRGMALDWLLPTRDLAGVVGAAVGTAPVARIVVFRLYLHDLGRALAMHDPQAAVDLDLDDLESGARHSIAGAAFRLGRSRQAAHMLASSLQYRLIERAVLPGYRHVYLASQTDIPRLPAGRRSRAIGRPNRLHVPPDPPHPPASGPFRCFFVGTLNYAPNEEAVRILVDGIVPALRARLARPWELVVVGRHASAELTARLQGTPEVAFTPEAGQLAAHYAASHVALVPLRAGGGTKYKSLEAFAHRRPVVATAEGVRGLGAVAGTHYLPAETADEFAAAVLRLASEPELAARIATAGWDLCRTKFATNVPGG